MCVFMKDDVTCDCSSPSWRKCLKKMLYCAYNPFHLKKAIHLLYNSISWSKFCLCILSKHVSWFDQCNLHIGFINHRDHSYKRPSNFKFYSIPEFGTKVTKSGILCPQIKFLCLLLWWLFREKRDLVFRVISSFLSDFVIVVIPVRFVKCAMDLESKVSALKDFASFGTSPSKNGLSSPRSNPHSQNSFASSQNGWGNWFVKGEKDPILPSLVSPSEITIIKRVNGVVKQPSKQHYIYK